MQHLALKDYQDRTFGGSVFDMGNVVAHDGSLTTIGNLGKDTALIEKLTAKNGSVVLFSSGKLNNLQNLYNFGNLKNA